MKYQPLYDVVIIKPDAKEEKSAGGIIIPDAVDEKDFQHGTVVAVGDGRLMRDGALRKLAVSIDQKVLFNKVGCVEVPIDGEKHFIGREENLIALIS